MQRYFLTVSDKNPIMFNDMLCECAWVEIGLKLRGSSSKASLPSRWRLWTAPEHINVYTIWCRNVLVIFFFFFVECSISIIESKRLFHFSDVFPNLWRMTKLSQDAIWLALTEVVSCKCSHGFLSFTCFSLTCAGKWSCTYFIKPSVLSKVYYWSSLQTRWEMKIVCFFRNPLYTDNHFIIRDEFFFSPTPPGYISAYAPGVFAVWVCIWL